MKENLTPQAHIPYSIRSMEQGESPLGGQQQGPQGAAGTPRTQKGEKSQVSKQESLVSQPVPPEQVEMARRAWEEYSKGKILTVDERQAIEAAIKEGATPMRIAGGAPGLDTEQFTDLEVRARVASYNAELKAYGETVDNYKDILNDVKAWHVRPEQEAQKQQLIQQINDVAETVRENEEQRRQREEQRRAEARRGEFPGMREIGQSVNAINARRDNEGKLRPEDTEEYSNLMARTKAIVESYPAPEASGIDAPVLELASQFKELREELINRILFRAYEDTTETNEYRESMTLYAQGNLDALLGYLSNIDRVQYDHFVGLRTAASLFHGMNALVIRGDISQLVRTAEALNYQHFTQMEEIEGVGDVMRLYEEKYQEFLARDERITTEGYIQLKEQVEKDFRALNEWGLTRSEYESERSGTEEARPKMEEWEIQRALNVGRTFFNLTFRSAERIATGQLPDSASAERYAGYPMEQASRLMNWFWTAERFGIAGSRGGVDFMKRMKRNSREFLERKKRKLGINKIVEFGGMKTNDIESAGMFGTSGVYSSWRIERMLFGQIKINADQTLEDWLDEEREWKGMTPKEEKEGKWVVKSGAKQKRSAWITQIRGELKNGDELAEFLAPVIENADLGLGVLLKHAKFSEQVGYKARQKIWEQVAKKNLPLMLDYLSKVQFEGEDGSRNRIRPENWTGEEGDKKWAELKERIMLDHAWKIKKASGRAVPDQSPLLTADPKEYDRSEEDRIIASIKSQGYDLAPDLADIVFPYIPFMNDVPFDLLDYKGPGETFYTRRTKGDLSSYNRAEEAAIAIMDNPGGIGAEEALKQFHEVERGIESPQGAIDAHERVFPMLSAWAEFVMAKPGKRQMITKAVSEALRQPTSIAQDYSGMEAESLTETQMLHVLNNALKAGILNEDLYNEMKKKKHLTLFWLMWALFRDIVIMSPGIAVWEVGKETMKRAA